MVKKSRSLPSVPNFALATLDQKIKPKAKRKDDRLLGRYEKAFVLFVDFLGFTQIVAKTRSTSARYEKHLVGKIREALDVANVDPNHIPLTALGFPQQEEPIRASTTFSDFTIVVAKPTSAGFASLIHLATQLTLDSLTKGFVCRGAISFGDIYCEPVQKGERPIVFGPAFLDAYLLESKHAEGARVILSNDAALEFQEFVLAQSTPPEAIDYLKKLVRQASDGPYRIFPFDDLDILTAKKRINDIKAEIESLLKLYTDSPRVFRKLKGLAEEFNSRVEGSWDPDSKMQLLITVPSGKKLK
jgi:hypothetical protein